MNSYTAPGSGAPYYDDFDKNKNYVQLLFNPATAVQARELTQSQTVLQQQIASSGAYMFKDGTPISGARITISYAQPFMKANYNDNNGQPIDVNLLKNLTFTGNSSGQQIFVIDTDQTTRNIQFSYLGGALVDGETFISTTTPTRSFSMVSNSIDTALIATCTEGTMFVNGYYITIPETSKIVAWGDINARYNIGFNIKSAYITSSEDASLNDPASGTSNFNAPGADRYQVNVELYSFKGDELPEGINFVQGIVVENTKIIKEQANPLADSELMDVLAKRTFDESGSYTVNPWKIQLYDDTESPETYRIQVQEGEGYVHGYNIKTIYPIDIINDKARSTILKEGVTYFNDNGLYTYALYNTDNNGRETSLSAKGFPRFDTEFKVKSEKNGLGNELGTCYIHSIIKDGVKTRIYIYNAGSVLNSFPGARSLAYIEDGTVVEYINLYINNADCAELYGQETPFIYSNTETTTSEVSTGSIQYYALKQYEATSNETGNTIVFSDGDEHIDFLDSKEAVISIYNSNGVHVDMSNLIVTPNNTSTMSTLSVIGNSILNSTRYKMYVKVNVKDISPRTKTITNGSFTVKIGETDNGIVQIPDEDVFDIVSVVQTNNTISDTPEDLKEYLTFENGQTDYTYGKGKLIGFNSDKLKNFRNSQTQKTDYTINYRYFRHSGIGPFCVNSYTSSANKSALRSTVTDLYSAIPVYTSSKAINYTLRDSYDFRHKESETELKLISVPRTEIKCNLTKYIPRIDAVTVNSSGSFNVVKGIPSETPQVPVINEHSMMLYTIYNSAYGDSIRSMKPSYVDNKRYTMSDIGALSKRITNVEDAVSLSQLETNVLQMQIKDEEGLNKYKTGIFTDSFSSFDNSDYTNPEWNANIDGVEQSLRANYNAENIMFVMNEENSSDVVKSGVLMHLPYTTTVYAKNDFASSTVNVQKLMFYVWKGALELTPSVDTWVNNLGQFIVKETWQETQKPTVYKVWSTTAYYENHRGENWGYGRNVGKYVTTTYTAVENQVSSWTISDKITNMESQDQFMRQRSVTYNLRGMRQGMNVSATINGVPLRLSDSIVKTDGTLTGTFQIPNGIPVGTKEVVFRDSANTSSANAPYTANGKTIWQNIDRTYIRTWTGTGTFTTLTDLTKTTQGAWDPVAQSFYIDDNDGIFLDSIDVYFANVDETMPVWLYLVEMENGIPTQNVVPLSTVYKEGLKNSYQTASGEWVVKDTSTNATVATKFKFEQPIYLPGKSEYAFVVATTSYQYSVFISTLGEPDLKTGIGIYEQPYTGSMFLSQNARTWNPEQQSDVTFKIHKCVFKTDSDSIALYDIVQPSFNYEVAMQNLVVNDFCVNGTSIKYEYKWNTESNWTLYNNREDHDLTSLKRFVGGSTIPSLQMRMTLKTTNPNLTPLVDMEQVYGIFCNNVLKETGDPSMPYDAGTYISKPTTLKYSSDGIRVILDAICPNQSKVDVFVQTTTYKPIYVKQSTKGSIGIDTSALSELDSKTLRVYYFDSTTSSLVPRSDVEMSGYDVAERKVYLRQVTNPADFRNVDPASGDESQYTVIDPKYTHILIMPVFSSTNISLPNWNSSSEYSMGQYVLHNNTIWKAVRAIPRNTIPSEMSISWQKIPCIKTVSETISGEEVVWRPMVKESATSMNSEKENQFVEYTYYPQIDIESEFKTFSVMVKMYSRDKVNIPRVRNLRAIATI